MPELTIAITGAMGPAGLALRRQCQVLNITAQVLALDMVPATAWPRYQVARKATDASHLPQLIELLHEHHISLLIPTVSEELISVAATHTEHKFPPFTYIAVDSPESVTAAHDKYLTMLQLSSHGVAVPSFGLPSDFASPAEVFSRWGTEAVVAKPRVARGSRGVQVFDSPYELAAQWWALDDTWILQSFASGTEYAPMIYRDGASPLVTGPQVTVVAKTELTHGRVGNAVATKITHAPDIERLALQTAEAMGLRQPVDLDIRRNADGRPVVLEVNARFGANSYRAPQMLLALLEKAATYAEQALV